ncbi:MAG: hypothetical protein A3H37_00765 [Candidatus Schekmanbacteria bacterium RIFCSPLOWO2_02_FULL_38_14]|nr:MAG: hypothetical protein A3H37_00765 [Candidatus Schekmanbacteria bacterium RIFCSPLOWO2_02_FULL_38_14]
MKTIFIGINGYDFPYTRVRCFHFAEELRKLGMETEVLSFRDHLAPQYTGIEMLNLGDKEKLRLNFNAMAKLFKDRKSIFYIQKVHYHSGAPFLLSRLTGTKFILDYDDWDIDRSPLFERKILNNIFFKGHDSETVTRNFAQKASACIAASRHLQEYLSQYNNNVFYLPTGVNTERFKRISHNSTNSVNFIWTGLIWGEVIYNNIVFILDCFSVLSKEYKNVSLKIVADGEWYSKVKEVVKKTYSECKIDLLDWIPPDRMPEVLSTVDIGLLPLIPDKPNEIWMKAKSPTKLFEYMAMELATVSTNSGEVPNIIRDGIDGFLGNDKEDFTKKMGILVKDYEFRKNMAKLARKKAEKEFSLPALGKKLFSIIKDIESLKQ